MKERRKFSNRQANLTPKGTRKEESKAQSQYKEGTKDQSTNK